MTFRVGGAHQRLSLLRKRTGCASKVISCSCCCCSCCCCCCCCCRCRHRFCRSCEVMAGSRVVQFHQLGVCRKGGLSRSAPQALCYIPLETPACYIPLVVSLHVFRRTKIFGYVAKPSLCYIPYVTGYVTGVGHGPCYKPIVLARAQLSIAPGPVSLHVTSLSKTCSTVIGTQRHESPEMTSLHETRSAILLCLHF